MTYLHVSYFYSLHRFISRVTIRVIFSLNRLSYASMCIFVLSSYAQIRKSVRK
jgi:hypothetical protein